ncbi:nuclear transport factor 2B-like [Anneissia japonica]|uniref:nuclear transport factor 2B-like n=1 Tax=Anneissia japonica TaxID=1529436 RepID=UPI0014257B83|nr:nuclear transport factor 2B-like [Anneissia japonica]
MAEGDLAQAFAGYFYNLFQHDRQQLANVFTETSTMTFEGQIFKGKEQIMTKLLSLPKNLIRVVTTADCQSLDATFSLVFLLGQLQVNMTPNITQVIYCFGY